MILKSFTKGLTCLEQTEQHDIQHGTSMVYNQAVQMAKAVLSWCVPTKWDRSWLGVLWIRKVSSCLELMLDSVVVSSMHELDIILLTQSAWMKAAKWHCQMNDFAQMLAPWMPWAAMAKSKSVKSPWFDSFWQLKCHNLFSCINAMNSKQVKHSWTFPGPVVTHWGQWANFYDHWANFCECKQGKCLPKEALICAVYMNGTLAL